MVGRGVVGHLDRRAQGPRIVLYSHDTMGLGHVRRNLLIAQSLASRPLQASVLLVTGAREATTFSLPRGVDCVSLPALHKDTDGKYRPRHLDTSLQELIALRAKLIRAAVEAFNPDLLIADNVPRGALGELQLALEYLRARGLSRCVLGLRDVLDDRTAVRREWRLAANEQAIRDYYDAVWVYGDRAVYDLVQEYGLDADVGAKVRFIGYLDQRLRLASAAVSDDTFTALNLPPGRLALCLVGGGQDGARLAEAFAEASLPAEANAILLTGPHMPADVQQRLRLRTQGNPRLRVLGFVPEPAVLVHRADWVVAMGGYNSICEVLTFEKRALIVPRVRPRREQLVRAERLRSLGLLDLLHPDEVKPELITEWFAQQTNAQPNVHGRVDCAGLLRLPFLVEELLAFARHKQGAAPPYGSYEASFAVTGTGA